MNETHLKDQDVPKDPYIGLPFPLRTERLEDPRLPKETRKGRVVLGILDPAGVKKFNQ